MDRLDHQRVRRSQAIFPSERPPRTAGIGMRVGWALILATFSTTGCRNAEFQGDVGPYLALETVARNDEIDPQGWDLVTGTKVVLLDGDAKKLHDLHGKLPSDIAATSVADTGVVVWIERNVSLRYVSTVLGRDWKLPIYGTTLSMTFMDPLRKVVLQRVHLSGYVPQEDAIVLVQQRDVLGISDKDYFAEVSDKARPNGRASPLRDRGCELVATTEPDLQKAITTVGASYKFGRYIYQPQDSKVTGFLCPAPMTEALETIPRVLADATASTSS